MLLRTTYKEQQWRGIGKNEKYLQSATIAWYNKGQSKAARWEWTLPSFRVRRTAAMEERYLVYTLPIDGQQWDQLCFPLLHEC